MSPAGVIPRSTHRAGRWWRLCHRRVGADGLAGGLLLALAAALLAYAPLLREEAGTRQAELAALRTELASAQRSARGPHRSQPEMLQALLPPLEAASRDLRTVFAAASRFRVEVPKGDYTLHRSEDGSALARLDIVLPIKDRYVNIKALVAHLLNELPHASLSELKLERPAASSNVLEARVRLTLHYRER